MKLPSENDIILSILELLKDRNVRRRIDIVRELEEVMNLTQNQIEQRVPSGERRFRKLANWVLWNLQKSGLLKRPLRGEYAITEKGLEDLKTRPEEITSSYVKQLIVEDEQIEGSETDSDVTEDTLELPEDIIGRAHREHNEELASGLLDMVKENTPEFFEHLVNKLLATIVKGKVDLSPTHIGGTGDGGVDGVLKDGFGFPVLYTQAKRWRGNVGSQVYRNFIGALDLRGVEKGIIITTSDFAPKVKSDNENNTGKQVRLINGEELVRLMIEHDIGVTEVSSFSIKKIDTDFFE